MWKIRRFNLFVLALILLFTFASCSKRVPPPQLENQKIPFEFEMAVQQLSGYIMDVIQYDAETRAKIHEDTILAVIMPFYDADTEEVPLFSERIEEIFIELVNARYPRFKLERLTTKNRLNAVYLIKGYIKFEPFPYSADQTKKLYHIFSEAACLKDRYLVGDSDIWMKEPYEKRIEKQAVAVDEHNPFVSALIKVTEKDTAEQKTQESVDTGKKVTEQDHKGPGRSEIDLNEIEMQSLMVEARTAFNQQNYSKALELFKILTEYDLTPKELIKTYGGIYLSNKMLGDIHKANEAFKKLVSISVEELNALTLKIQFHRGSYNEFIRDEALQRDYNSWLKLLGEYFSNNDKCLKIIGHCSRTGTAAENLVLSRQRAEYIKRRLSQYVPYADNRIFTEGRGFYDPIVGDPVDNERTAIDKRVEFSIVKCD